MLIAWILSPAGAREPCPPLADVAVTSRSAVLQAAQRGLEGYRAQDVRVVDAARCDIEGGLPALEEELGPADAGRIHLAYAAAAQITGESPEAVTRYLAAARASDAYLDDALVGLVGEDDPLVGLYRAMVEAGADEGVLDRRLPPAWTGAVLVNGQRDSHARVGPYVLQLASGDAGPDRSFYVEAGTPEPRYVRKRPVIAGLALGSAALGATGLALGAKYASEGSLLGATGGDDLGPETGVDGADLVERRDDLQARVDRYALSSDVATGAGAAFGLVALGMGVWYVTTF